jgi:hypothetical protein
MCTTANRNRYLPSRKRHVGSSFSPLSCVGSLPLWRLSLGICRTTKMPQRLIAGNFEIVTNVKGQRETGLCLNGAPSLLPRCRALRLFRSGSKRGNAEYIAKTRQVAARRNRNSCSLVHNAGCLQLADCVEEALVHRRAGGEAIEITIALRIPHPDALAA